MARLKSSEITAIINDRGFVATDISGYSNVESDIIVHCKNEHEITTNLRSIRKSSFKCPLCHGGNIDVSNLKYPPEKKGAYRVIAFDNASENMGVSVYDDGELTYYALLKFRGVFNDRLLQIHNTIKQVVIPVWEPDFLVFEDVQYQNNYNVYKKLSMLLGVLVVNAKAANLGSETILAKKWRSHYQLTGTRAQLKARAIALVKKMYDITVNDDIAEAILIGRYAADQLAYKLVKKAF